MLSETISSLTSKLSYFGGIVGESKRHILGELVKGGSGPWIVATRGIEAGPDARARARRAFPCSLLGAGGAPAGGVRGAKDAKLDPRNYNAYLMATQQNRAKDAYIQSNDRSVRQRKAADFATSGRRLKADSSASAP